MADLAISRNIPSVGFLRGARMPSEICQAQRLLSVADPPWHARPFPRSRAMFGGHLRSALRTPLWRSQLGTRLWALPTHHCGTHPHHHTGPGGRILHADRHDHLPMWLSPRTHWHPCPHASAADPDWPGFARRCHGPRCQHTRVALRGGCKPRPTTRPALVDFAAARSLSPRFWRHDLAPGQRSRRPSRPAPWCDFGGTTRAKRRCSPADLGFEVLAKNRVQKLVQCLLAMGCSNPPDRLGVGSRATRSRICDGLGTRFGPQLAT